MGKDIFKGYMRYLKLQRGMSGNTLDAYQRDLQKLLDYLVREEKDVLEVTLEDLQHFAAGLHDIGIHPRSQCRILSGIRSFYHYLLIDGYRDDDPTELLESPQIGEHLPEVLSTAEVDQLEASIELS
jgi:tyrosine recombinase XerD subunit